MDLRILRPSQNIVELHHGAITSIWKSLGICGQEHKGLPERVLGDTNQTYKELTTFHTKIEAILSSRSFVSIPGDGDDDIILTPGHFFYQVIIGSLGSSLGAVTILWQWNLCLALTRYFWNRRCADYFFKLPKWYSTEELQG